MSLTIRNVKKISRKGRKSKSKADGANFSDRPYVPQEKKYCSSNQNQMALNSKENKMQPILYNTPPPPPPPQVASFKATVPDQVTVNCSQQGFFRCFEPEENKSTWTFYNLNYKNNYNWYLVRNCQTLAGDAGTQNFSKNVPEYYYPPKCHVVPQRQVNSRNYFTPNGCNNVSHKKIALFNKAVHANTFLVKQRRSRRNRRVVFWNQATIATPLQNLERYCLLTNCPKSCNIDININLNNNPNEPKEKEIINIKAKNANLLKCKQVLDNVFENYEVLPDNTYPNTAEVFQSVYYVKPTKRRPLIKVKTNFKINLFAKPFLVNRKRMQRLNSPTRLLPSPPTSAVVISKNKMCQTREHKLTNDLHPYLNFSQRHQVCTSYANRRLYSNSNCSGMYNFYV